MLPTTSPLPTGILSAGPLCDGELKIGLNAVVFGCGGAAWSRKAKAEANKTACKIAKVIRQLVWNMFLFFAPAVVIGVFVVVAFETEAIALTNCRSTSFFYPVLFFLIAALRPTTQATMAVVARGQQLFPGFRYDITVTHVYGIRWLWSNEITRNF